MTLQRGFQFSQGSLQAYVDCPRRFQLRYLRRLRWPAIETEPVLENEHHLRQGAAFHRIIHQHVTGIPVSVLSTAVSNPELRRWWQRYLKMGLQDVPPQRYPEVRLSASLGDYSLVAQYDLIAVSDDGQAVIVDWKTNRRRPPRAWLSERLQTHVYPFVLVQSGQTLGDGMDIQPDGVTMVYWFANFASEPERVVYGADKYQSGQRYLISLVEEIEAKVGACADEDLLPVVEDRSICRICRYRSLCQCGVEPGWSDEMKGDVTPDDAFDVSLDLEQIGELALG